MRAFSPLVGGERGSAGSLRVAAPPAPGVGGSPLVTFVLTQTRAAGGDRYRKMQVRSKKQPKLKGEPDAEATLTSFSRPGCGFIPVKPVLWL